MCVCVCVCVCVLVGFYGLLTLVDYLMPNPIYVSINIYDMQANSF